MPSALLFVILGLLLLLHHGKSWDGGSYLYDGDEFHPVVDYKQPTRTADETYTAYDQRRNHPEFLSATDSTSRIVVFYSPWCPHCQHYVNTYVKIARELTATHQILFYAVSCNVHNVICTQQEVAGYPTIKFFPPEHSDGKVIRDRDSSKTILEEIELLLGKNALKIKNTEVHVEHVKIDVVDTSKDFEKKRGILLTSRVSTVVEDQSLLYADAAASFKYALRYSVLMFSYQPMNHQSGLALRRWLELLNKTLPYSKSMDSTFSLIHNLLDHFQKVVTGDSDFLSKLLVDMGDTFEWSSSCSHNSTIAGSGYTCGLWHLFHIMTIGLVEWNQKVSIGERVSTIDAALTLRNYIENFFACDECRSNFLEMYDTCGFDHCHLLTGSTITHHDWEQLSLWLHEVHNDVRVRILTESLSREELAPPSLDEIQSVKWPPLHKCPKCWNDAVSSSMPLAPKKLETFKYMRRIVWTESLDLKSSQPELNTGFSSTYSLFSIVVVVALAFKSKKRFLHPKAC